MNKIEKMKRREHIKEVFFKCLHVISYILATLFIIIALASGIQSCSKKQDSKPIQNKIPSNSLKVNMAFEPNVDNMFSLIFKYNANFSLSVNQQQQLTGGEINLTDNVYTSEDYYVYLYTLYSDNSNPAYVLLNGQTYDLTYLRLRYYPYIVNPGTGTRLYRLYSLECNYGNDLYSTVFLKRPDNYSDTTYELNQQAGRFIIAPNIYKNSSQLQMLYNYSYLSDFYFNDPFNYNAPLNYPLSASSFPHTYDSQTNLYVIEYDLPYFLSNGQIFNRIRISYDNAHGHYFVNSDNKIVRGSNTYVSFLGMTYWNTDTNTFVYAFDRNQQAKSDDNGQWFMVNLDSGTWSNFNYRKLTFLSALTDQQNLDIQKFNNNYDSAFTVDVTGTLSVFTLLSNCFYSLSSFWSIMILPGITIGTLFFLPLVMMIILTIVYLLRK